MVQLDKTDAIKNIEKYIGIVSNHFEEHGRDETFLKAEEYVLNHGSARDKYMFVLKVPGADITKFQKSIIESGNPKYMYYLARVVPDVDIFEIVKAICNTGSAKYIYKSALKLSLICSFKDVVKNALCLRLSKIFKLRREYRDMLDDAMCETKDAEYIRKYAQDVPWANKQKLVKAMVETDNAEESYILARCASGLKISEIEALADVVIRSKNPDTIWYFMLHVPKAPIVKMIAALCKLETAEYIYYCLKSKFVNSYAMRRLLIESLCNSGNTTYILEAARHSRQCGLEPELKQMLADAMLVYGDKDELREFILTVHGVYKDKLKAKYNSLNPNNTIKDETNLENVLKELNDTNITNN